jgi:hypothetical protein
MDSVAGLPRIGSMKNQWREFLAQVIGRKPYLNVFAMRDSNVLPTWRKGSVSHLSLEFKAVKHHSTDKVDNHRVGLNVHYQQESVVR